MTVHAGWHVGAAVVSLALIAAYEVFSRLGTRGRPERLARAAHASIRATWARALAAQPGSEILAVQTLRNSLMSATIVGSTAALALMGSISLGAPLFAHTDPELHGLGLRSLLVLLLMAALFATLVLSALAMRLYNHAGFVVSLPVGSAARTALEPVAEDYLRRAGWHYSRSLRLLFMVAPLVAGVVSPLLMPPAAIGLVLALRAFDRAPRLHPAPPVAAAESGPPPPA